MHVQQKEFVQFSMNLTMKIPEAWCVDNVILACWGTKCSTVGSLLLVELQ